MQPQNIRNRFILEGNFNLNLHQKPGIRKYQGLQKSLFGWLLKLIGVAFKITRDGPLLNKKSAIRFILSNRQEFSNPPNQLHSLSVHTSTSKVKSILFNYLHPQSDVQNLPVVGRHALVNLPNRSLTKTFNPATITDTDLTKLNITELSREQIELLFPQDQDNNKERFAKLPLNHVRYVLMYTEKLFTPYLISLLSDEQIKGIHLNEMVASSIEKLFPKDIPESKERFALLQGSFVNNGISRLAASSYLLEFISNEQLSELDISKMYKKELEKLFPEDQQDTKERFQCIQGTYVKKAYDKELLSSYHLGLLSENQQKDIDTYLKSRKGNEV